MTNSEILQRIVELKTEINEQTDLCSNIFKLKTVDAKSINELIADTESKIELLKKYQAIISTRNMNKILIFRDAQYIALDLIKLKEEILLKKKLKQVLINTKSDQEELLQISLEAFQSIQDYKKSLGEIHIILEEFNNETFDIEEY